MYVYESELYQIYIRLVYFVSYPVVVEGALFTQCFKQIYPDGIRHIRADKRVNEWKTPGKKTIVKCAVNERQVRHIY